MWCNCLPPKAVTQVLRQAGPNGGEIKDGWDFPMVLESSKSSKPFRIQQASDLHCLPWMF